MVGVDRSLVGLLDFKSSGSVKSGTAGSIPVHFRHGCLNKGETMIGGIGMTELIIILVIILIIFGAGKLPEIGGGIGKAIKNFKKATKEPDEIDVTPQADGKESSQEPTENGSS